MKRIDGIEDDGKKRFDDMKAQLQSCLGYNAKNGRVMCRHPAVLKQNESLDREAVKDMTDAEFLSMLMDLWTNTELKERLESVWSLESFSKFKSTLIEKKP